MSSHTRRHAQRMRSLDFVQIQDLIVVKYRQMNGLLGFIHEPDKKGRQISLKSNCRRA